MDARERVKQHAVAIRQLETAEADVKRAEENLANFRATLEYRRKTELETAEKDVKKAEDNLDSLRKTLDNRRKAVAEFDGGETLVADPSPATHVTTKATATPRGVAKFDELPGREPLVAPAKP